MDGQPVNRPKSEQKGRSGWQSMRAKSRRAFAMQKLADSDDADEELITHLSLEEERLVEKVEDSKLVTDEIEHQEDIDHMEGEDSDVLLMETHASPAVVVKERKKNVQFSPKYAVLDSDDDSDYEEKEEDVSNSIGCAVPALLIIGNLKGPIDGVYISPVALEEVNEDSRPTSIGSQKSFRYSKIYNDKILLTPRILRSPVVHLDSIDSIFVDVDAMGAFNPMKSSRDSSPTVKHKHFNGSPNKFATNEVQEALDDEVIIGDSGNLWDDLGSDQATSTVQLKIVEDSESKDLAVKEIEGLAEEKSNISEPIVAPPRPTPPPPPPIKAVIDEATIETILSKNEELVPSAAPEDAEKLELIDSVELDVKLDYSQTADSEDLLSTKSLFPGLVSTDANDADDYIASLQTGSSYMDVSHRDSTSHLEVIVENDGVGQEQDEEEDLEEEDEEDDRVVHFKRMLEKHSVEQVREKMIEAEFSSEEIDEFFASLDTNSKAQGATDTAGSEMDQKHDSDMENQEVADVSKVPFSPSIVASGFARSPVSRQEGNVAMKSKTVPYLEAGNGSSPKGGAITFLPVQTSPRPRPPPPPPPPPKDQNRLMKESVTKASTPSTTQVSRL